MKTRWHILDQNNLPSSPLPLNLWLGWWKNETRSHLVRFHLVDAKTSLLPNMTLLENIFLESRQEWDDKPGLRSLFNLLERKQLQDWRPMVKVIQNWKAYPHQVDEQTLFIVSLLKAVLSEAPLLIIDCPYHAHEWPISELIKETLSKTLEESSRTVCFMTHFPNKWMVQHASLTEFDQKQKFLKKVA